MSILNIRKRSGNIVSFDQNRIVVAINKAVEVSGEEVGPTFAANLAEEVVMNIEADYNGLDLIPSVEDIQDLVEKKIVESGNFEIAKVYILYRAERARARAESRLNELKRMEKNLLKVVKFMGRSEVFDINKISKILNRASFGLRNVDVPLLLEDLKKNIFDGIATSDISKALVMVTKSYIERDSDYSFLAARLLLTSVYKEVFHEKIQTDSFSDIYQRSFEVNMKRGVEAKRISKSLLEFDYKIIGAALVPDRDCLLTYLGAQTLYDRYFIHINEQRIEAPQHFWMRVAMGLAQKEENKEEKAIEFYEVLSTLRFVCSTPTLFNSGTTHQQLSSCYLSSIDDNLEHIFKVIKDNAMLSKWAGGIGNDWTRIRATGSHIEGTNGKSQGVIPFMKIANDTAVAVNQGGKRKGAVCAYLETWHIDIIDFLELRKNTGDERRRTPDMSTANWVPDLFMQRVISDQTWTLFSPNEVSDLHDLYGAKFKEKYEAYEKLAEDGKIKVFKKMKAAELWRKMITMLFETGHPWITFKDPCNVRSPQDHVGVVHSSNLCTEITLNSSRDETAVCNLGSINMAQHYNESLGDVDKEKLANTVKVAMRMLDNVVDINYYPIPETNNANVMHRPVGLGFMGFQDILYAKDLDFDSEVAVDYSDELMEYISYNAILASSILAKERGSYHSFVGSKWDRGLMPIDTISLLEKERGEAVRINKREKLDWQVVRDSIKAYGMRNSNCLAIAPTATISNISGCIPCIEPIYKNLYVKSNMGGEFTVMNKHLVDELKRIGMWNMEVFKKIKINDGSIQNISDLPISIRDKYKETFEIDPIWFIKHAAVRAKWLDQSQSVNIFYRGQSGKVISDIYISAWLMGLKTTYYLRTLGASQVEKSTVKDIGTHKRDNSEVEKVVCAVENGANCDACQ
ncbi:ribonucleoside-diphosphate reductase subunit alpha [Patescibacteria group bacterium]|nr:ribonucleoside-diphosphate reductase subunit alpha [Patescibacteria group bacterium]